MYAASNRKDDTIGVGGASGDAESRNDESMGGWDDLPCRTVALGVGKLPTSHTTTASLFTIALLPDTFTTDHWKYATFYCDFNGCILNSET